MSDSNPSLPTNSDEAWKLHTNYAKARLVWQLAYQISASTPVALRNLIVSCLANYTWSEEEQAQIRKIVIVLNATRELHEQLEILSQPLINTYKRPSSSAPTSTQSQTATDAGDAHTSKPE
jgi:hypothetical protein